MEPNVAHGFGSEHQAEKPTQILRDEHRLIERVLTVLEGLSQRPVAGSLGEWKKAVDFFRHFADACHHFKEEKVLFPAMEEHGVPGDGGPIGMMLMEHEEGRSFVRAMLAAISLIESKQEAATGSLLKGAEAYIRLLREHIQKEDEILFPMADGVIPEDEQRQLVKRFETYEAEEMGAGVHEKYLQVAQELERAAGS